MPLATQPSPAELSLARQLEWSRRRPDLRQPSADELRLLTEAFAAGARSPSALWAAYFSGESQSFPVQWEGGYVHLEDLGNAEIVAAAEQARARRDAFLARVRPGGDLYATHAAVSAALVAQAVAA